MIRAIGKVLGTDMTFYDVRIEEPIELTRSGNMGTPFVQVRVKYAPVRYRKGERIILYYDETQSSDEYDWYIVDNQGQLIRAR